MILNIQRNTNYITTCKYAWFDTTCNIQVYTLPILVYADEPDHTFLIIEGESADIDPGALVHSVKLDACDIIYNKTEDECKEIARQCWEGENDINISCQSMSDLL